MPQSQGMMVAEQNQARQHKKFGATEIGLCILLIAGLIAILFVAGLMAASALQVQDLAQYWAAAHLIKTNPYSFALTANFEKAQGLPATAVLLVTKVPPWGIMLVVPFYFFSYQASFAIWFVISLIVVPLCARASWNLLSSTPSLAPGLLALLFGPTVVLLILGQLTVLVLLGVTLFLVLIEKEKDWLAGASLLLVASKPHVTFVFLLVVALWVFRYKRWRVLLSGALSVLAASAAAVLLNPKIFVQFLERTKLVVGEDYPYPNLGGILFHLSGHHFLALIPQLAGIVWVILYWRRHQSSWEWKSNAMFVLLVSVACSYYSYPYDEILVLPALTAAFANGNRRLFLIGFIATNFGYFLYLSNIAGKLGFGPMFLWWTASAWLATFLLSQKRLANWKLPEVGPEMS